MHSNTWLNEPSKLAFNTETEDCDFFQDNKVVSQNDKMPIKIDFIETHSSNEFDKKQSPFVDKTFIPELVFTKLLLCLIFFCSSYKIFEYFKNFYIKLCNVCVIAFTY